MDAFDNLSRIEEKLGDELASLVDEQAIQNPHKMEDAIKEVEED